MNLQYISDHKGEVTGVFIPIEEWETLRKKLKLPQADNTSIGKQRHRQDLLEAFEHMRMIRAGVMAKPSLDEFLNKL